MKKKVLFLILILILTFSIQTFAKEDNSARYSEVLITNVNGNNILDINFKGHVNHLEYRFTSTELNYGRASGSRFNILIGYNFDHTVNDKPVNSSILMGIKQSKYKAI